MSYSKTGALDLFTIKNFKRAVKNPKLVYNYINDHVKGIIKKKKLENRLFKEFFLSKREFLRYREEVVNSGLITNIDNKLKIFNNVKGKTYRRNEYIVGALSPYEATILYAIIRKLSPNFIIETGVCNGYSTSFILLALKKQQKGRLYSIDFPEVAGVEYENETFWEGKGGAVIPKDKQSGWLVPENFKDRWTLILGKSQDKLPELLKKLKSVDVFIHDSEHSYECMWFEFNSAWDKLEKGGILIADNISENNSFFDFAEKHKREPFFISPKTGFIIK